MKLRVTNICPPDLILAIDDDCLLLDSVKGLLESAGCTVLTASNPIEGIKLYETYWQEIKLVLLDYSMKELRGDEVLERLQQANRDVRVIMMSGCDGDVEEMMLQKGLWAFVQKPFSPEDLIDRVRVAINYPDEQTLDREGKNGNEMAAICPRVA
jgi:two-component system cell cycle sensor histidine kinase/response regulator CckA